MKLNIVIPYRPLSVGSRVNPLHAIHQLPDGKWAPSRKEKYFSEPQYGRKDLYRAIHYLNKNSAFKHNIIVVIDEDVYPNPDWLSEYDNVRWMKTDYVVDHDAFENAGCIPMCRMASADKAGIESVPDDEWIVYAFIEDLIVGKNWDIPIMEAIIEHGDQYVYVPMFVESHGGIHGYKARGMEATPELIWDIWRKIQCCHCLLLPEPECGYVAEEDFDKWMEIARRGSVPKHIIEPCGVRQYGYYAVMVMKAKIAKEIGIKISNGFDVDFDGRLYVQGGYMKVVCTNSFVLHPYDNAKFPFPYPYGKDEHTHAERLEIARSKGEDI